MNHITGIHLAAAIIAALSIFFLGAVYGYLFATENKKGKNI